MKTVYLYDEKGLYTGTYDAHESPRETGAYITPDLSTDIQPIISAGYRPVFINDAWVNTPDFRGMVWDKLTGDQLVYDDIGILPAELTKITKPDVNCSWYGAGWAIIPPTYQELRAASYPDFRLYLDGIVKGDTAQVQAYIDNCLAVKARHPKP